MTGHVVGVGAISTVMFTGRAHARVMNDIHRETMHQIRDTYWPFHFMTAAYSRYGDVFAKRSKRWQMLKARTVHHQRPNVWTGELQKSVLNDSVIRATSAKGTLTATAPKDSTIKFGRLAGKKIARPLTEQRRKELEFVSDEEIKAQTGRMQEQYLASTKDPRFQSKVLKQFR